MSFFTTPAELSDEDLDAIAEDDALKRAALAERDRRIEERRLAAEEEARQKAKAEERERVAALLGEHERAADVARRAHDALGASIVTASALLGKRNAARDEVWRVRTALKDLGAEPPPFDLAFTVEAMAAGRVVGPLVDREMTESPYAGATRNSPDAFR